ncbi:MAG: 50S ribosomal protein P1 [Thaumarchaeota archaeon]|nr:50S ribosomal protein P1 [Nitrososphaerota archaeon]
MEYVYAALILHKLKKEINEPNVTSIIQAAGGDVNTSKVKALVASLSDVDIEKIINSASVSPVQTPQQSPDSNIQNKEKESKTKEEKSGKTEEQAMEGLASLFG